MPSYPPMKQMPSLARMHIQLAPFRICNTWEDSVLTCPKGLGRWSQRISAPQVAKALSTSHQAPSPSRFTQPSWLIRAHHDIATPSSVPRACAFTPASRDILSFQQRASTLLASFKQS